MQEKKIRIAIKEGDSLKRLPTSNDVKGEKYFAATVNARALMSEGIILDQWKEVNPRDIDMDAQACRAMEEGLNLTPSEFVYLNKGLLILVKSLEFNQQNKSIDIVLVDKKIHGLVDGGHTFEVLKNFIIENPREEKIEIRVDFIVGITDRKRAIEIATARNTSTQVKELSIMNMKGKFDKIKVALKQYDKFIAYKENDKEEKEEKKPVSVRDIISYLMCFDVDAYPISRKELQPITVYSGKATTLKKFDSRYEEISSKYAEILPKIVELRDEIYKEFPSISPKLKKIKNNSNDKPIITENKKNKNLYFIYDSSNYGIFDGLYFPVLAAFRALIVETNGVATFSQDPVELFHRIKNEFAPDILIGLEESDNNPQTFGKRKSIWASCLETVKRFKDQK